MGLDRSQVDVEIVSQGRPGILGFGGEPARVVVHPLTAGGSSTSPLARPAPIGPATTPGRLGGEPLDEAFVAEDDESEGVPVAAISAPPRERPDIGGDDAIAAAVNIVERLLNLLQIDAEVTSRPPSSPGDGVGMVSAVLDIEGPDLGLLIGRRGETLASLQYIVNLMLARHLHKRVMVGIDIGGYRRRREESLRNLARRLADQVRATGQSITMEPLPPAERRIVHITLADSPHVLTVSIGEGDARKVAITPRR